MIEIIGKEIRNEHPLTVIRCSVARQHLTQTDRQTDRCRQKNELMDTAKDNQKETPN